MDTPSFLGGTIDLTSGPWVFMFFPSELQFLMDELVYPRGLSSRCKETHVKHYTESATQKVPGDLSSASCHFPSCTNITLDGTGRISEQRY